MIIEPDEPRPFVRRPDRTPLAACAGSRGGASRPLFICVAGNHNGVIPSLEEYTEFHPCESINGVGGALEDAGLIPAPRKVIGAVPASFQRCSALGT